MSPQSQNHPPPARETLPGNHASQAVERIREILVGRQLEGLDLRLARLEGSTPGGLHTEKWEDRMCTAEARLEALQNSFQRMTEAQREEFRVRDEWQKKEIQRISAQVLNAARSAAPAAPIGLEQKISTWLSQWQTALQSHLAQRDQRLLADIRKEVALLWESTEGEITSLKSHALEAQDLNRRLRGIAEAARQLAEAAEAAPAQPEPAEP